MWQPPGRRETDQGQESWIVALLTSRASQLLDSRAAFGGMRYDIGETRPREHFKDQLTKSNLSRRHPPDVGATRL
ncbi:hypothetical protein AJ87_19490 [Rhizobium yanglingense]|nr:hypothetical protein AJ87_19490 [Rhizobium yanglingense]